MVMLRCGLFSIVFILSQVYAQEKKAVAVLQGKTVSGVIHLVQSNTYEPVKVTGTINGLSEGEHGFHIHEKGDLTNGCASTGSHYNPEKKKHGAPHVKERHNGDLGNIKANKEGIAQIDSTDHAITLHGRNTVIGRSFVVHADPDDFGLGGFNDSLTTGHAGSRLACGVIGIA